MLWEGIRIRIQAVTATLARIRNTMCPQTLWWSVPQRRRVDTDLGLPWVETAKFMLSAVLAPVASTKSRSMIRQLTLGKPSLICRLHDMISGWLQAATARSMSLVELLRVFLQSHFPLSK